MVAEKEGELTRVQELLIPSVLQGRIMSADARYAQTSFCHQVIAAGGDDLLFVKQNQPTLDEDVPLFVRDPPLDGLDWRTASTTNKGQGRVANRRITVCTELNDFLARYWHEVGQVFCLRSRVQHALKCPQHLVSGITSLTPKRADPARLLEVTQGHWVIANRLHCRRDVTDAVKMPAKSARAQPLMRLQCSMPLYWPSSISAESPTSNSRCAVWMLTHFKPSASYSSLCRKFK
jgi:hypothetical protein